MLTVAMPTTHFTAAVALLTGLLIAPAARAHDVRPLLSDDAWHLFAVEVARSEGVAASRLVAGASEDERVAMSWYFFVAVGHGRVVLIDCATDAFAGDAARRAAWSVTRGVRVVPALARLELTPRDVTDVVLTHHHWDHAEGLVHFPRARVHVHEREWERVVEWVRAPFGERVTPFRTRRREVHGGLRAQVAGRHTSHQLMVDVPCADHTVVIASDAAYLYRNVEQGVAVAETASEALNVRDVARAVDRVGRAHVIPGHDPRVFERHPTPTEGVAAICP